jgi:hypothetical protein
MAKWLKAKRRQTSATLAQKVAEKTYQKHVNITEKGATIDAKSIQNHKK